MSRRTFLLCASLGTLVFTAVPMTGETDFSALKAIAPAEHETAPSSPEDPSQKPSGHLKAAYAPTDRPSTSTMTPPAEVDTPTLWLARAIYSETKQAHEQELVAWVIRNRVQTEYRGSSTYREVVLDPYQFSAFNPGSARRSFFKQLTPESQFSGWQQALWIAHYVRRADSVYRPFPLRTRHFYSERSMKGRQSPYWADRSRFVAPGWSYVLDERRFRFYEQVS